MRRDGLLIGEVAAKSGTSRKALRLYEAAGILPIPRRTAARYRLYGTDTLRLLAFVLQARRLGFTLAEIKEIVSIKRSGRAPCPHVRDLVHRKAADLDRQLADLTEIRAGLRTLLNGWSSQRSSQSLVCPHIEHVNGSKRRTKDGKREDITLHGVHRLPGSRNRRQRSADRRGGEPRCLEEG